MTDLIKLMEPETGKRSGAAEFFLGTCVTWGTSGSNQGVAIRLDGQNAGMTKRFKLLNVARMPVPDERVLVMKQSGTYVVIGSIIDPIAYYTPAKLASGATLATVISTVNTLIDALRSFGTIRSS